MISWCMLQVDGWAQYNYAKSVGTFLPNALSNDISVPIMLIVFTDCDTISHYNQASPQG